MAWPGDASIDNDVSLFFFNFFFLSHFVVVVLSCDLNCAIRGEVMVSMRLKNLESVKSS